MEGFPTNMVLYICSFRFCNPNHPLYCPLSIFCELTLLTPNLIYVVIMMTIRGIIEFELQQISLSFLELYKLKIGITCLYAQGTARAMSPSLLELFYYAHYQLQRDPSFNKK
jgi:hypothetical protein